MKFGKALKMLRAGKTVRREVWLAHYPGIWLTGGESFGAYALQPYFVESESLTDGHTEYAVHEFCTEDILADDWVVVD